MRTLFLVTFLFLGTSCSKGKESFPTFVVDRGEVLKSITFAGRVEATKRAVITSPYDSLVDDLRVRVGERVVKGQILVSLDAKQLNEEIRSKQSELSRLNNELRDAQISLKGSQNKVARTKQAYTRGFASRSDVDEKATETELGKNKIRTIEDRIRYLQQELSDKRKSLEQITLRSPISGMVTETWVPFEQFVKGTSVKAGDTLVTVSELGEMKIVSKIREQDVLNLNSRMPATISLKAIPDKEWQGEIFTVDEAATIDKNSGVATFRVSTRFRPDVSVKSGMQAQVSVVLERTNDVLRVPKGAVKLIEKQYMVLLSQNKKWIPHPVVIGNVGDSFVEIKGGLDPGQVIQAVH
jgi:RND family efflux transporter MFP subunit